MIEDHSANSEPDASDVVEGPVGSASLRDPATSGPMGADLEALPSIEVDVDTSPDGETASGSPAARPSRPSRAPAHDRQDQDHIGVDWDPTERERRG